MAPMNRNPSKEGCPRPTYDTALNTRNRNKAIRDPAVAYGPANPSLPNLAFWSSKARLWGTTRAQAQTMRCGNCLAFNVSQKIESCIGRPAAQGGVGYCTIHKFKCAAARTCDTWVHGGPSTTW